MKEYAFDVKLWAVARVKAESEEDARKLLKFLDCLDLSSVIVADGVELTSASLEAGEEENADLFEVDEEMV